MLVFIVLYLYKFSYWRQINKIMDNITINESAHSMEFDAVCLPPNKQIPLHSQDTWELSCVITGEGTRVLGDVSEPFAAGDTVLIPPGIPHCWYFNRDKTDEDGNIENISIFFRNDFLLNLTKIIPELSEPMGHLADMKNAVIFSNETRDQVYSTMLRMRTEVPQKRILSLMGILLVIAHDKTGRAISGIRQMSRSEMRMAQIKSFINCNYMRDIKIDEMALHIGMNRSSFCSFFKQQTGQTFTHHLNDKRIAAACGLLRDKDMNISETGLSVGIPDTPYFCRIFKQTTGFTPTEYRNHYGNNNTKRR